MNVCIYLLLVVHGYFRIHQYNNYHDHHSGVIIINAKDFVILIVLIQSNFLTHSKAYSRVFSHAARYTEGYLSTSADVEVCGGVSHNL